MEINENHKQHLLSTFQYIDKLFTEIEQVLPAAQSHGIFEQHISDISPQSHEVLQRGIAELRGRMSRVLEILGIDQPPPRVSSMRAVLTFLTFVDIALEELNAKHMRAYGEISQAASSELDSLIHEMQESVKHISNLLSGVATSELQEAARGENTGQ